MFFKLFKTYRIYTITLIMLMACAVWGSHILSLSPVPVILTGMPLFKALMDLLGHSYLPGLIMLGLSILIALYLNRQNTLHNFITERSYLPAFFFIVIAGSLSNPAAPEPAVVSLLFVLFAANRVITSFKNDYLSYHFFDASILIGIASLFYFPSVFFIIMLFCVLALLRPFFWREWLYSILGVLFVYFILWSVYYLYEWPVEQYFSMISACFTTPYNHTITFIQYFFYGLMVLLIFAASFSMIRIFSSHKIFSRKVFQLWLIFFIVSSLLLLIPSVHNEVVIFIAAPLCYLFTNYFISLRTKWFREAIFILILGLLYLIHFL